MRPKKFVNRSDQKIAIELLHVYQAVRGVMHRIHIDQCAHAVRQLGNALNGVDGAEGVGGVAHGHEAGFFVQQAGEQIHA